MIRLYALLLIALLACASASSLPASDGASACPGKENKLPINEAAPKLEKSVKNGKLYTLPGTNPPIKVAHLYGSAYEMGYAQGELLKDAIEEVQGGLFAWVNEQINENFAQYPKWVQEVIDAAGDEALKILLDLERLATESYTGKQFKDEIRGLSDAIGQSYKSVYSYQMFPELIKASCTIVGAWAKATTDGSLYQVRALDWGNGDAPFPKHTVVLVYHPTESGAHDFMTVTWAGLLGAITGFSSIPVGISQKVWIHYNGTSNRFGVPFNFLLRDILEYDTNVDDALSRIATADRTCSVFLGIGDGRTNEFRALEYSYEHVEVWDGLNQPKYKNHPTWPDAIYIDKHTQPSHNPCLGDLMSANYGRIDAPALINMMAIQTSGDFLSAVYEYSKRNVYLASAGVTPGKDNTPAYTRQFVKLNMTALFNERQ